MHRDLFGELGSMVRQLSCIAVVDMRLTGKTAFLQSHNSDLKDYSGVNKLEHI